MLADKNVNASQLCRPAIKEIRALRRTLKKKVMVHKMFNCVLYAYQIGLHGFKDFFFSFEAFQILKCQRSHALH